MAGIFTETAASSQAANKQPSARSVSRIPFITELVQCMSRRGTPTFSSSQLSDQLKKNMSVEILPLICTPAATFQHHSACKTPKMDPIYLRNPANKNPTEVISLLCFTQMREEVANQYITPQTKHKVKQTLHLISSLLFYFSLFKLLHFLSHQHLSALTPRPPPQSISVTINHVILLSEQ